MIEQVLFWVFAILACGGAFLVVATQNIVRMAFWLVISLGSVAALFFLLHAEFLGAAQLLIYVGGTVVLLVFGVMLTASGPYTQIQTSPADVISGTSVGLVLLFVMIFSIGSVDWAKVAQRLPATSGNLSPADSIRTSAADGSAAETLNSPSDSSVNQSQQPGRTLRQLGLGFVGLRPDRGLGDAHTDGLGPGYLLPFEIISMHLLIVLIGAAYLARAKRRRHSTETGELS